nr:hypothetical protein GCM10025699_70390 [Microbacterium flavescens]
MNRLALPFAVTFTALVALTGCTSGSSGVETPTATVTDTATVTATPSAAASATPSAPAGVDGEDGGTGGPDTAEEPAARPTWRAAPPTTAAARRAASRSPSC